MRRAVLLCVALLAVAALGLAHAGSARADVFRACGYGGLSTGPVSCLSLPDAIAAALATNGRDTIRLFPGLYCPVEISGNAYGGIDFVGMGWGGFDLGTGPVSLDGFEASTVAFKWSSSECGGSAPSALVTVHAFTYDYFTFRNLTFDGSGADGPTTGLSSPGDQPLDLVLRDVIVENMSGTGVDYVSGPTTFSTGDSSLDIENSAILDDGVGVETSGYASISSSTIYGSATYGVVPNGKMSLIGDTITGNAYGLGSLNSGSSQFQAVNTLLARNTLQDCSQPIGWNAGLTSSHNLVGDTSCGVANGAYTQLDTDATIGAPVTSGAITPFVQPPEQAAGAAECNLYETDQREFLPPADSCYAGSVQPGGDGTPVLESPSLDLGQVDVGPAVGGSVTLGFSGGGTVDVNSVELSGEGWSLTSDGCTFAVLVQDTGQNYCTLAVSLTPATVGTWSGSIAVHTLSGDVTIPLTADAVVRPVGVDDAYDVDGGSRDVASPGVLENDAPGTTVDEIVQAPGHGTLTGPATDGAFSYTPDDGFYGDDSFQYTIADGDGVESHPITVTLHVLAQAPGTGASMYVNADWAGVEPGLDPDGAGPATAIGADAFATIADALAAAGSGAAIHVAAGTYDETAAQELRIEGAGIELLGAGAGSTHVTVAVLRIWAPNVILDGLDLHGTGTWSAGSFSGPDDGLVVVEGGAGSIVRNCALSDAYYGIQARSSLGEGGLVDSSAVEVRDDDISHVVVGVDFDTVAGGTADGNSIHDTGSTAGGGGGRPQAAIALEQTNEFLSGDGNTVSDNTIEAPVNHGIAVRTGDNTITGNTITGAGSGYPAFAASSGIEIQGAGNEVTGNTIRGSAFAGIRIVSAGGTTVSGNTVTGTLAAGDDDGYSGANGGGSAIVLEGASGTTISGNTLTGNAGWGISQADASGGAADTVATGNDVAGNTTGGVDNLDASALDATGNWWGDASGPGGDGPGSGDTVVGAAFDPWLACPFEDAPCTAPTNQPPVAAFNETASGLAVSFDASASADGDGTIASFAWSFGDGSTGSGATPLHTYASAATYTVTLTVTDDGGATASATHAVTVTAPAPQPTPTPTPTVQMLVPNSGPVTGGTQIVVVGSDFTSDAHVSFGSTAATTVTVVNGTAIRVVTPPLAAGVYDVTVTTSAGRSALSDADKYTAGAPVVSALAPSFGPIEGGTRVAITGNNFPPDARVAFGTQPAVDVTYVSPTEIDATSPPGAFGSVAVTVGTPAVSSPDAPGAHFGYSIGSTFRPEPDGFSFQNYGPAPDSNMTGDDLLALFGRGVCTTPSGACQLTTAAQTYLTIHNDGMRYGHCFGFATLSELLWENGLTTPYLGRAALGTGATFAFSLGGNIPLQRQIALAFNMQTLPEVGARFAGDPLTDVVADLLAGFTDPSRPPYVLAMFGQTGAHAVTPYALTPGATPGTYVVSIYDNNYPDDTKTISIDTNTNSWSYSPYSWSGHAGTGGFAGITLFPLDILVGRHPDDWAALAANGGIGRAPAAASALAPTAEIALTGGPRDHPTLVVTDARGRRQGMIGGTDVSEIPGGHVVRLIGGIPGVEAEPLEHVPAGTDVTLHVDGSSLSGEATGVALSEIGPGFVVAARGLDVRPGEKSSLAVRGDGTGFTYTAAPDAATTRPRFELARTTAEGDYRVDIEGAAVPAGTRITAALDPATLKVRVTAAGVPATDFHVAVTRRDPAGGRAIATAPVVAGGRPIGLEARLPRLIAGMKLGTHRVSRRGTRLSYVDSRPGGRVTILTQRALQQRCHAGRRCVRWVRVGRVTHTDLSRRVSVHVGAALHHGRYRVAVVAGGRKTHWVGFTVR